MHPIRQVETVVMLRLAAAIHLNRSMQHRLPGLLKTTGTAASSELLVADIPHFLETIAKRSWITRLKWSRL